MRFVIKVGNEIVGFSDLEYGDPAMGVAGGRFVPTPAYKSIQQQCIAGRDVWEPIPNLTVELEEGQRIEGSGGIQIIDFSPELGEKGVEVHVNGIPYPLYGELFPQHVEAYRKQFRH